MGISFADLIEQLYRAFLGREPEPGAVQAWVGRLEAGMDVATLVRAFLAADEFRLRDAPASGLFVPPGHFYSPIVDPAAVAPAFGPGVVVREPAALNVDAAAQLATWERLLPYLQSQPFADDKAPGLRYFFNNPAFGHADGAVLHGMLRSSRPRRLVEAGSGYSSACALDTIDQFLGGEVEVTFIEPHPQLLRQLVEPARLERCTVLPHPVQATDPRVFEALEAGDILFIDSTHVMKTGSDVCHELFEILPRLQPGVLIHFHDVFWPFEYPAPWVLHENRSWNEVYGLRAFLMYNRAFQIEFFCDYFSRHFRARIEAEFPTMLKNSGGSLWLSKLL